MLTWRQRKRRGDVNARPAYFLRYPIGCDLVAVDGGRRFAAVSPYGRGDWVWYADAEGLPSPLPPPRGRCASEQEAKRQAELFLTVAEALAVAAS